MVINLIASILGGAIVQLLISPDPTFSQQLGYEPTNGFDG